MYIQDESVQSWFFRHALISGESKFNSIIGTNGKWYFTPNLVKGWVVNIDSIPDLDLLLFLRKSGIANKKAGMFDNPVDYLREMSIVNPSENSYSASKGQISIRFCKECIEESIKENGFGYLKATWLSSTQCATHSTHLIQLTSVTRKDAVKDIQLALAGCPTHSSKTSCDLDKDNNLYKETTHESPYHIMPCLLRDFYMWASKENTDPLLENTHPLFKYEHWAFLYSYGAKKEISDEFLHQKYLYFKQTYPSQFKKFLDRNAEVKEYKFSFRQKHSLSEMLLKSKSQNCSKCLRWASTNYCPIKPIKVVKLDYEFDRYQGINPCDFFLKYRHHNSNF